MRYPEKVKNPDRGHYWDKVFIVKGFGNCAWGITFVQNLS